MEPLAETTSGHVGAWNPHKANAPKPPVTAGEALSNTQQGSLVGTNNTNTNNAVNYPDVTLDSGRAVDSGDVHSARISGTEEDVTDSEHSVVPDYPLDSLQRPTRTSTSSQHSQGTRQSHDSGNVENQTRPSHNSGNTETTRRLSQSSGNTESRTPRESTSSNGGTASAGYVSASRPQQTQQAVSSQLNVPGSAAGMSQRTSGGVVVVPPAGSAAGMSQRTSGGVVVVPPVGHPRTVPHPGTSQPVVSHSNVSVNVTSAPTDDQNRHIRTQDLNIGVTSSRLDIQRQTAGALPDLIAHSQIPPPAGARPAVPAQRPQPPVDPRTGAYISRQGDPNGSRHRHHHGDRRHRSRRHSHRNSAGEAEEPCKETCFKCIAVSTSFRWILVVLSLMGVCCVVTGIVLAALHASGNSYLFLAIMFIGKFRWLNAGAY